MSVKVLSGNSHRQRWTETGWDVRSLQLSHIMFSVTFSRLYALVLILNFSPVSFFLFFFVYWIMLQSLLCLLKCIREVDSKISVSDPRYLDVIVNYCRRRLKLPCLKLTPQKPLKGQLFCTKKHIFYFNLFIQILPVMKTEKLKLD